MTESPFAKPSYDPDVRKSAEDRADVPRDQYDRYLVKLPGMEHMPSAPAVPLTRVSTITKALIQKKGINEWRERLILEAVADADSAILAGLKQAKEQGNRKQLKTIGEELFKRGGGKERSQLGTAMHAYTEKRNRGEDPGSIPDEHLPSLAAYDAVLENRVRVMPQFLERRLIAPWSAGGTLDNIVMYRNDLIQPEGAEEDDPAEGEWDMRVADLKTGRDLSKGWAEKVIQLWEYANAEWFWDEDQDRWVRPPRELRKDRGLIIHVPMDGTAALYDVDLSGVDRIVEAAMIARRHNDEAITRARVVATADRRGPAFVLQPGPAANSVQHGQNEAPADQAAYDYAANTISPEFAAALAPDHNLVENRGLLTADGSGPLQPLAGEGKRGCGACGRAGHKRNSPKCWGDADPAKGTPTALLTSEPGPGVEDTPAVGSGEPQAMANGAPHPTCPGHGGGWTNRGDGVFVCEQCGLPSPAIATTLTEAVQTGQFPPPIPKRECCGRPVNEEHDPMCPERSPHGEVTVPADPRLSVPAATVPDGWSDWVAEDLRQAKSVRAVVGIRHLALQRESWKDDVHGALAREAVTRAMRADIDTSPAAGEILIIRDAAIQFGAWVPEQHDAYARSRWEALMREGKR